MAEEFEESEILFEELLDDEVSSTVSCDLQLDSPESRRKKINDREKRRSSAPVRIPGRNNWFRHVEMEYSDGDGEMVPPHVIIGRRVAEKIVAFSLCTGNGRTLKGRDLSEFRNSILRLTGFLET
ncbi:hypothetical protein ABFS82_08G132900 [Erythranthe guttata]|uniref:Senescence regulator S40 n=1 Tax=Erythranthe guttata TaxID=4155 RepID=A0A022RTA2_ERYGU|nr:PREDICTED: uncharacterized protein LOC105951596 [Erythranthe guttata]EYU43294.1 hypothetical protein MIMGU_mgv1a020711mg [Erythranthe guttata]|eukprot:XP_012830504.1 PREDICTED: uncharacterized protein LOC105951596 [Erythranthe guttata]